ncbi:LamG-like jellyroll fold domain-containing protein [Kitasatospora sp. NPDC001664]
MHQQVPAADSPRPRHRAIALLVATTITTAGLGGQAVAEERPPVTASDNSPTRAGMDAASQAPAPDGPVQLAKAKAKASGKPVVVEELTTSTSLTVANPDGTLTRTDNLLPIRVKQNGTWAEVDATLAKNPDGSYSPKATPSRVTLSGGGTGPFVTLTDPKGRSLSLTLPFALPQPAVAGDGVEYTGVLPGVDLRASVTDQGGFRQVLVIHNPEAAANPALKSLRMTTSTSGLTTTAAPDGSVTARAADGSAVFSAPAPVMWDSSTAPQPVTAQSAPARKVAGAPVVGAQAASGSTSSTAAGSANAVTSTAVDPADVPVSSHEGPGHNAKVAKVAVAADSSGLTLVPDAAQLTSPDTTWPVYIDPYVNPINGYTNHYVQVKEGCPSQKTYDIPQDNGEGTGFQQYSSDCYGLYRSFYEFNTSQLDSRMVISKSTLKFTATHGGDRNCNASWPIALKHTGGIDANTVWPGPWQGTTLGTKSVQSSSVYAGCGNHPLDFEITDFIRQHVGYSNLTFGLFADEGKYGTNYGFTRFATNPSIQTVFDVAPNAPTDIGTSPGSQNPASAACGGGDVGWIGRGTGWGGSPDLMMNARLSTDMSGVILRAGYHLWDNMAQGNGGNPYDVTWKWSPTWVASGGSVSTSLGVPLADGHQYGWNVWANDGTLDGPASPNCHFNVDLTPPDAVSYTESAEFPPLGSGKVATKFAGDQASITVSARDPKPTGCNRDACINSGVRAFEYSFDANIPAGGGTSVAPATWSGDTASATIPITVPRSQWGTHTLYVRALDWAGNSQPTVTTYSFYAPWNQNAKVTAGDLTGDGVPDLLASTANGNLNLIKGNTDPTVTPVTASTGSTSPEGNGWNDYLLAHRSGVTQQGIDDLFAYNKPTGKMYLYKNDATATPPGTSGAFTKTQNVTNLARPDCVANGQLTCADYPSDWSKLTQMTAPGPLSMAAYKAAHPAETVPLTPDLITVENGRLWYYVSGGSNSTYFYRVYPIGTGDWNAGSLVGVGNIGATVTGTGSSATTTGGTPTLWVRNTATGAVNTIALTFDSDGLPTSTTAAPTVAPLVSGVIGTNGKNMCIDVNGAATTNGIRALMWDCNGTKPQQFTFGSDNTVHALGRCLDVSQGGLGNGSAIQMWDCNNTGAQQWIPGPFPGALLNPQSGRCLADPAASNTPGTQLMLWDCLTNNAEQNWAATTPGSALPQPQPVLPLGIDSQAYPALATPGDVNGDGNPDLYTLSTGGQIITNAGTAYTANQATDRWRLTDTVNSNKPANVLNLNGGAAITTNPARGKVLTGNATTAYASSTTTSVDTGKSFTVSAWVNLTDLTKGSTFVSQSGTVSNGFQLYYSSWAKAFAFGHVTADDSNGVYNSAYGPATGSTAPRTNTWYHLAGVYDAVSKKLTLYINGNPAATTDYTGTTWNATGTVQIGRRLYQGGFGDYLAGSISDVQLQPTALPHPSVIATMTDTARFDGATTLGTLPTTPIQLS